MDKSRREKGLWWDRALSLVEGCFPVSIACDNCWLAGMDDRFKGGLTEGGEFSGEFKFRGDRLDLLPKTSSPTIWAIWSDLFYEGLSLEDINQAMSAMEAYRRHTYLVLTKRAYRLPAFTKFSGFHGSDNIWIGTTVEDQAAAIERIPYLLQIPGKKFLSVEPMLGPIDFSKICITVGEGDVRPWYDIDGVIVGCESGPHARETKIEWIRDVKDQCVAAGVPVFIKQAKIDGKLVKMPEIDGVKWDRLPWDKEGICLAK